MSNVEELRQAEIIFRTGNGKNQTELGHYGAQLRNQFRTVPDRDLKLNQVEYVIHELMNNHARRIMTTYDVDDLDGIRALCIPHKLASER